MITRTRDYLARAMAPQMGMTHQNSRRYLDLFLEEITKALKRGDEVVFRGFGRFTPVEREARTAYNPQTQEPIKVPAKTVTKFKPYGELAELPQEEED